MANAHDRTSGIHALKSGDLIGTNNAARDPLSDVLNTVRLKGALFFLVNASSPWCVAVPEAPRFAGIILPSARHVVSYHIVVEGSGLADVPGSETVRFEAGDIIVFPHADRYHMYSKAGVAPELDTDETLHFFEDLAGGKRPFVVTEGGGNPPKAKFICGFLGCDLLPFNPLFAALPRILHIRRKSSERSELLARLVGLAMDEVREPKAGGESIRLGLCELMFVELLRCHLHSLSADTPGWLAGLKDPNVGLALKLLHGDPAKNWTLEALARAAAISRSVLAERFAHLVGETPMRYLTLWRMQQAARLLADGASKVSVIAEQVGFQSEAAFSRTFKRITGLSPSDWRRANRRVL